jgi:salicylate hydroxylase
MKRTDNKPPAEIAICGGGIVGLVLALAIKKHLGIIPEVYEKATAFHDDVGAALSMYSNGLRVIRDISHDLLHAIRENGAAYEYRRWEDHTGKIIAESDEFILCDGEVELSSIGIRRWKLQKVLYDAMIAEGIPIIFSKATVDVQPLDNCHTEVTFQDGTKRKTQLLFACDGGKSIIREILAGDACKLKYTGVTCMMGISESKDQPFHGISFPSSQTTHCHSVYFPTGK